MTFLTARFPLGRTLTEKELERLRGLTTRYGFRKVSIEGETLALEYDASRLHSAEVLSCLRSTGIDVKPEKEIPPGAFDQTGEFRDFAWPMTGLSPANQPRK